MRNMPKVIGTGKDIYNLLGMVQAGTLEAAELREVINGLEEEKYIFVPVVEISEDKRYITTNYLAEAEKGAKVLCEGKEYTIKSVEHVAVEQQSQKTYGCENGKYWRPGNTFGGIFNRFRAYVTYGNGWVRGYGRKYRSIQNGRYST